MRRAPDLIEVYRGGQLPRISATLPPKLGDRFAGGTVSEMLIDDARPRRARIVLADGSELKYVESLNGFELESALFCPG